MKSIGWCIMRQAAFWENEKEPNKKWLSRPPYEGWVINHREPQIEYYKRRLYPYKAAATEAVEQLKKHSPEDIYEVKEVFIKAK